ncbi:hypothetical protein LJC39_00025 [Parabacteroides sp. OttesenSCG-928-B22]|nr:hypothetical protein [Parabacteroides sp. OttesenSCG-928-B22]
MEHSGMGRDPSRLREEIDATPRVKILIPVYKPTLSDYDRASFSQAYYILGNYPLAVIKPASLDLKAITDEYPQVEIISFPDHYFAGIAGYNRLMMSSEFYGHFLDMDYLLIYQLDAYVFRDELLQWCQKGYDYVGAPWLKKKIYQQPPFSWWVDYQCKKEKRTGIPSKYSLHNKVGNGGFSLRKVKSHYDATVRYRDVIEDFLSHRMHLYNEDVFWATQVAEFTYPDVSEALRFSFDKYPRYSYKLTKRQLPFGCHGWYKRKMKKFWQPIIGF